MPYWVAKLFQEAYRAKDVGSVRRLNKRWLDHGYKVW